MQTIVQYAGDLKLGEWREYPQATLSRFNELSPRKLKLRSDGHFLTQFEQSTEFVQGAPDHSSFCNALAECEIHLPVIGKWDIYDTNDLASAELLYFHPPYSSRSIHKAPHPGALLYRGVPPIFLGIDRLLEINSSFDVEVEVKFPQHGPPMPVNSKALGKRDIVSAVSGDMVPSVFVSKNLRDNWEAAGVTGASYWACVDHLDLKQAHTADVASYSGAFLAERVSPTLF